MSCVCNAEKWELLAFRILSVVVVIATLQFVKIVGSCQFYAVRMVGGQLVDATIHLHLF